VEGEKEEKEAAEERKEGETMKACKRCHLLTEGNVCAFCNSPTSDQWQGYVIIIDPQRSRISQAMGIKMPGKYALKVR
jgi:DNA-directed RNA polymerase subunit E"